MQIEQKYTYFCTVLRRRHAVTLKTCNENPSDQLSWRTFGRLLKDFGPTEHSDWSTFGCF